MCKKCNKKSCSGCSSNGGSETANLENQVAELSDAINDISNLVKFLKCGHPMMHIQNADDVDMFNLSTGKGSDCWEGWAICDGQAHYSNSAKKNITTPNLTDRFIVQAGGAYSVNDTGGADEVTLAIADIPAHAHNVIDPGHTHVIVDPGHDHAVTDPGHTHLQNPHTHNHNDTIGDQAPAYLTPTVGDYQAANRDIIRVTEAATATNQSAITGLTVNDAFTGISATEAQTGIVETEAEGGGTPHENRPPYFATLMVMYIG